MPIFTFTANWDIDDVDGTKPSEQYIKTIVIGLKDFYKLDSHSIIDYLCNKKGIKGNYTKEALEEIVQPLSLKADI